MKCFSTHCKKNTAEQGLTLVEVVIALGIIGVAVALAFAFQANVFNLSFGVQSDLNTQFYAQTLLRTTIGEIRSAGQADSGAHAINTAEQTAFTFYSDIDDDGEKERIRYFLEDTTFKKGVIEPSGVPVVYDEGTEEVRDLLEDVRNTDVFTYFDSSYNGVGTTTALTFPVSISDIRLIQVRLEIDRTPGVSPEPFVVTTQATMRNLKDNL